ncbi:uncharacterized protein BP5553_08171 [Venustampulla echinocandica]|uniref:Mpv17 pmp22 family protein n=1 Tax=Venustampulla echinocandica TaxID=2656787 RepID=A0A370TFY5_9HELO|nr:uncharacterized protein BP5553_08171 [Venustampulla echinocandica]RDL33803.1 hypothetical protein BP5553_08171 [Venustampulla echinocandica]
MYVFAVEAAGRAVLRRSHLPNRQLKPNITKRRSTNTTRTAPGNSGSVTSGTAIPVPNTIATLPLWQRLGPLTKGFQAYGRSQRERPYTTQFCSSLVIYILGDLSAQSLNGDEYDPKRTLRALIISAGSSIPSYKWFMFLGNNFNYSSKFLSLVTKVSVNQMAFTPIFNTYFFGMQSLLSGDSLPEVWDRIKRTVPTSMINSCKLWPAVTAFSFTFIEAQYRSIFAGVIAIGWQTYLSYLNRKAEVEALEQSASSDDVMESTTGTREDNTRRVST